MRCLNWIDQALKGRTVDDRSPSKTPRKYGETRSLPPSRRSNKSFWDNSAGRPLTPPTPALPVAASFKTKKDLNASEIRPLHASTTPVDEPLISRPRPIVPDRTEKNRFSRGSFSMENSPVPTRFHSQNLNPNSRFANASSDPIVPKESLNASDEQTQPSSTRNAQRDSIDTAIAAEYLPSFSKYVSSGVIPPKGPTLRRRNRSSTSTIFQNSPLAPVTIIVTTPDDDGPPSPPMYPDLTDAESQSTQLRQPPVSFSRNRAGKPANLTLSHSASMPSINTIVEVPTPPASPTYLHPNSVSSTSFLQPPTENQIDHRRLRKAQEYREIRKFIIGFMNSKGDQFPKSLRMRMMYAYSISDADLDPRIVEKFRDEVDVTSDEGVVLNERDGENAEAEDLRILTQVFRSQIPAVMSAAKEKETRSIPPFRGMRNVSNDGVHIPIRTTSIYESRDMNRTFSEPDLHKRHLLDKDAPPVPQIPHKQSLTAMNLRAKQKELLEKEMERRSDSLGSTIPSEKDIKILERDSQGGAAKKRGIWGKMFGLKKNNSAPAVMKVVV